MIICCISICHLYSLKASREPLATLEAPYDKMWMTITKVHTRNACISLTIEIIVLVIDSLHMSNHKAAKCHDL